MKLPNHIAIILDGNGRWAKNKGMPRSYGHIIGCDNLEKMCNIICEIGVRYLTVYAFSTENWKRSKEEIKILMNLFRKYLKRCEKSVKKNQMRVKIIGDPERLEPDIQRSICKLEDMSKDYDKMFFRIALNYGGRDEILRAVTRLVKDARQGKLPQGKISEEMLDSYLDTPGIPDPDLLIRTSGEQRLSNFMLWQLAYTEFYFTDVPWPAFDKKELDKAIEQYNERDRRYGDVKEEKSKEGGACL
ncbi:MAG: isoprenyl transferase [Lachnospiraceae bacterium]|nr:isoprenyl transferase [Lachnospiraceae bacterium]